MKRFIAIIAAAILMTTGCSTFQRITQPNIRFHQSTDDYEFSEPVSGEATVVRVFGIDWKHLFNSKTADINNSVVGRYVKGADNYAIYDMLQKNPGYDIVINPQSISEHKGFAPIYLKTTVVVTARLGKLK